MRQLKHEFHMATFSKPTWCLHCSKFIFGLVNQGHECKACKFQCHKKCVKNVTSTCTGGNSNINNNNTTNNNNININNNNNNKINNNSNNNTSTKKRISIPSTLIAARSSTAGEPYLAKDIWFHIILSFLDIGSILLMGSTCTFMFFLIGEKEFIAAFNKRFNFTTNPPPYTSWRSHWINMKQYTFWNVIKERVKITRCDYTSTRNIPPGVQHVKAVLIGPCAAGKSCLLQMTANPGYFREGFCRTPANTPEHTVGASLATVYMQSSYFPLATNRDFNVQVDIWDTAGQERYSVLYPMYTRGADVLVFVYDTSHNAKTLDDLDKIIQGVKGASDSMPCLLVGLKVDLPRVTPQETALKFARDRNMSYVELSSKARQNTELPFLYMAMASSSKFPKELAYLLRNPPL